MIKAGPGAKLKKKCVTFLNSDDHLSIQNMKVLSHGSLTFKIQVQIRPWPLD